MVDAGYVGVTFVQGVSAKVVRPGKNKWTMLKRGKTSVENWACYE
jgi:hypothetical protein